MYRIETHLHTTYISHCGWLGAQAIMKYYSACGYDAICVTAHYNRECFDAGQQDAGVPAGLPPPQARSGEVQYPRVRGR